MVSLFLLPTTYFMLTAFRWLISNVSLTKAFIENFPLLSDKAWFWLFLFTIEANSTGAKGELSYFMIPLKV